MLSVRSSIFHAPWNGLSCLKIVKKKNGMVSHLSFCFEVLSELELNFQQKFFFKERYLSGGRFKQSIPIGQAAGRHPIHMP
ncbi:hypothetical protein TNCT_402371 [Trichonephila clavata]|uniref:Uncharacterized protein n=1 Tax=Trichonephila clavata TaxID=2740835 RepID=A0A8X6IHK9_TRICU|nr:hypothetical protein TNCT_402371 [Trichonephila clavata]